MPLFLTLLSLFLTYFSPDEIVPSLASYHIQQLIIAPSILATLGVLGMSRAKLLWPHAFLIFGLWASVVLSIFMKGWWRGSIDALVFFALLVAIYFLVAINTFTLRRIRLICGFQALCALVMAVEGIIAFHTGYMADRFVLMPRWEGTGVPRIRGLGVLNDPNDFAQFLLMGLGCLGAFWDRRSRVASLVRISIPAAAILYAVHLTGSRGAIFAVAVVAFVGISKRLNRLEAIGITAGIFVAGAIAEAASGRAMTVDDGSAVSRVIAWGSGIADLRSYPIFGVGFRQFTNYNDFTAHNSFVLCFAELGMLGYFFWLALILTSVVAIEKILRNLGNSEEDQKMAGTVNAVRAALYGFLVAGFFLSRTYNESLYVLLALCSSLIQIYQSRNPGVSLFPRWVSRTFIAEIASIVLIYVFVRVRAL